MTHIDRIQSQLNQYTGFDLQVAGDHLTVMCLNKQSFPVRIFDWGDAYQVEYSGWLEEFYDLEDALACFHFAFSQKCRLKVVMRGNVETNWTPQSLQSEKWIDNDTIGRWFIPFWRKSRIVFQYNRLIPKE